MELRLTEKEHKLLLELLQEHQKHLLHQIAKTDHHEFKTVLLGRYAVLEAIMDKVKEPVSSTV